MYEPNQKFFDELARKYEEYRLARQEKRYETSDMLRKELEDNGVRDLDSEPVWHPVFESTASRMERLK